MIRSAITPAGFEAIAATLPLGSVGFEPEVDAKGERSVYRVATEKDAGPATSVSNSSSERWHTKSGTTD